MRRDLSLSDFDTGAFFKPQRTCPSSTYREIGKSPREMPEMFNWLLKTRCPANFICNRAL